jgi:pimeloyl-ACP methyl ester carboxylesterase
MSPVVSYIYQDTLAEPSGEPNIFSPIVSYQYFDWVGGDNIDFKTSPEISYFYNISLQFEEVVLRGQVIDPMGEPIAGAQITIGTLGESLGSAVTGLDGSYELNPVPSGIYTLTARSSGYVSSQRILSLDNLGARQDFMLFPAPSTPELKVANSTPAFNAHPTDPLEGAEMLVFDGSSFIPAIPDFLDTNKMTIVLTHGWNDNADYWPLQMANTLAANQVLSVANIIAWDWRRAAGHGLGASHRNTIEQGRALGEALRDENALGSHYSREIHFIGHSLGTLVNAAAANYLHGDALGFTVSPKPVAPAWQPQNTHLTLFDEAELAVFADKGVVMAMGLDLLSPLSIPLSIVVVDSEWINSIPVHHGWIDNYVSAYGSYHSEAVNILLQKAESLFDPTTIRQTLMHAYPYQLYEESIRLKSESDLFFRRSFEAEELFPDISAPFPPEETMLNPPASYRQSPESSNDLVLEKQGNLSWFRFPLRALQARYDFNVDSIHQYASSAYSKFGETTLETYERTRVATEDATQWVLNRAEDGYNAVIDTINQVDLRISLATGLPTQPAQPASFRMEGLPSNTPAFISVPVIIPPDAVGLLFDFKVSGEPVEDCLVFGIDNSESGGITTNLFALKAKFFPPDQLLTSDLVDIESFSGTTNTLFFGILGGTSTNCAVQLENVRFIYFSAPNLEVSQANGTLKLSWPTTATGYVLESSPSLVADGWMPVPAIPVISGDTYSVGITSVSQTAFYRLVKKQ